MSIKINDNFFLRAPKPLDDRMGSFSGGVWNYPSSVAAFLANTAITPYRYPSLTVTFMEGGVQKEYWFVDGVADADFKLKLSSNGFVDLITDQTIDGNKTFVKDITANQVPIGRGNGSESSIAIGAGALQNSNERDNTIIGYFAGSALVEGAENTAVGFRSLSESIDNEENTAVGHTALRDAQTGNRNTAIGHRSAFDIVTPGNDVTLVGANTSILNSPLSNAGAFGASAVVDENNKIQLGNPNVNKLGVGATIFSGSAGTVRTLTLPAISGTLALESSLSAYELLANKATNFTTVNNTLYPTVQAVKTYADALVVGLLDDRGSYNASSNVFPSTGGSGTSGAILKGDLWFVSVAGTLGGQAVNIGDSFRALVDSPGQTVGNWNILEANIGYVPENIANKQNSLAVDGTNTKYPTVTAVNTGLALKEDLTNKQNSLTVDPSNLKYPTVTAVNAGLVLKENTANKQNSLTIDGTGIKFPTVDAVNSGLDKKDFLSTGLIAHAALSATVGATVFNISSGFGVITDFTTANNPTITPVTITSKTGITPQFLNSSITSYVAIDVNNNVVQSASPFTAIQRRDLIVLGAIIHSNLTTINAVNNIAAPVITNTNQLHDLFEAVGPLNTSGNKYIANGANLNINKSAGAIFKLGVNFINNWREPNSLPIPLQTALTFRYRTQTGTEFADTTAIDPGFYDVAGTRTAIPGSPNQFTIQRITIFQSGLTRIQYGQNLFANKTDAIAALGVAPFVTESNIAENGIFRAYLVVRANATTLNDLTQAEFIEVGKFGSPIGNAGGAVTFANIVAALGYTPENVANKQNNLSIDGSGVKYPTVDAVLDGFGEIHSSWFGVDNTGVNDAGADLQSIIETIPSGYTFVIDPGIYKLSNIGKSVNDLELEYGDPGSNFQAKASLCIQGRENIEVTARGATFNCINAGVIIYRGNNVNWTGGEFVYVGSDYLSEPFALLTTRSVTRVSYTSTIGFMRNIVQSRNLISSIEWSESRDSIYFNFYSTGKYDIDSGEGYVGANVLPRMELTQNRSYNGQTGNYFIEWTNMFNNLSSNASSLEVNPGGSPAIGHIVMNQGDCIVSENTIVDTYNMNSRTFGYGIIANETGGVFNINNVLIQNNIFDGLNFGIGVFGATNVVIKGNSFKGIWTTGVVSEPTSGFTNDNLTISNNLFDVKNVLSTKTDTSTIKVGSIHVESNYGHIVENVTITGNEILNVSDHSIYIKDIQDYFISSNVTNIPFEITGGNGFLTTHTNGGLFGINKINPENVLDIEGEANGNISLTRFGNAPVIRAAHANGSKIAPTGLLATNTVSSFNAVGYNGTNYVTVARLGADVVSDFTGSLTPVSVFIDQTSLIDTALYRPWYTDGMMRSTFSDKPKNTLESFNPTASINSISHGDNKPIFDGYDSLFVRKIRLDYDGALTSSSGGSFGKNITIKQTDSANYPSLGTHSGGLSISNSVSGLYGIDMGVHNFSGNSWIQAHRNNGVSEAFDVILQPSGGKVGVANTSPAEALDVTGNATVSGSLTASTYNGSATLTGTPTAPTATAGTNTTQIATTAFVVTNSASKANLTGGNSFTGGQLFTNGTTQALISTSEISMSTTADSSAFSLNLSSGLLLNTSGASGANGIINSDTLTAQRTYGMADVDGTMLILSNNTAPATSASSGKKGTVIISGGFRYECVSDDSWVRSAVSTF